jgi:hypothetical protein
LARPVSNQGAKKGIPATAGVLFFASRSGHSATFCDAIKADEFAKSRDCYNVIPTNWRNLNNSNRLNNKISHMRSK